MDEKEQLRRLKGFFNAVSNEDGYFASIQTTRDIAVSYGLWIPLIHHKPCCDDCVCDAESGLYDEPLNWKSGVECGYKKAEWLKDE